MSKLTARNALVVIGLWAFSRMMAFWVEVLIGVMHIRITFTGDVGMVMMWLWDGLPYDLFAALAAITLVWVIETEKPLAWVGMLAALYLYGEGMHAWRTLTHGWHEPLWTSAYIGILTQAIVPALACFIAGTWWRRRSAAPKVVAT
jgi:hypothetical protein